MHTECSLNETFMAFGNFAFQKMRMSTVVELLLILLLIAFAAYGRVIGENFIILMWPM